MGCFLVWRKPWLIRLCFVVWASAQCLFESLVLRHLVIAHASNIKKLLNELFPQGFFFNSLRGKRKCHYKQFFFSSPNCRFTHDVTAAMLMVKNKCISLLWELNSIFK